MTRSFHVTVIASKKRYRHSTCTISALALIRLNSHPGSQDGCLLKSSKYLAVWFTGKLSKTHENGGPITCTISFCFTGFLIAMTVLSNDWYGFANAIAMV